jgi:hypothetical protein
VKLEFSHQISEKYSNIKFRENPSSGSQVVPCGETDERKEGRTDGQAGRRHEANTHVSKFSIAHNKTSFYTYVLCSFLIIYSTLLVVVNTVCHCATLYFFTNISNEINVP